MRLVEKYRPKTWEEVIGQDEVVANIREILKRGTIPHMMFLGPPGTGKTSVAHLIAKELNVNIIELNASVDRGIDIVRGQIKRLAMSSGFRILFLDEADQMTDDAQEALRRTMETSKSTVFIIAANQEWKIIAPIKSRCAIFRFRRIEDGNVLRKLLQICQAEGITIKPEAREALVELVKYSKGDLRLAINTLETIVTSGKELTPKSIVSLQKPKMVGEAIQTALRGDFERAKEMMEDAYINYKFNLEGIFEEIYEELEKIEDREVKIRLYSRLSDIEERCKFGNPLIHLVAFLAFVWIAPHLRKVGTKEEVFG